MIYRLKIRFSNQNPRRTAQHKPHQSVPPKPPNSTFFGTLSMRLSLSRDRQSSFNSMVPIHASHLWIVSQSRDKNTVPSCRNTTVTFGIKATAAKRERGNQGSRASFLSKNNFFALSVPCVSRIPPPKCPHSRGYQSNHGSPAAIDLTASEASFLCQ